MEGEFPSIPYVASLPSNVEVDDHVFIRVGNEMEDHGNMTRVE